MNYLLLALAILFSLVDVMLVAVSLYKFQGIGAVVFAPIIAVAAYFLWRKLGVVGPVIKAVKMGKGKKK